jgi:hypothetical protein
MHPLHTLDLKKLTDAELQEKIGLLMQRMQYAGANAHAPLWNQLHLLYEQYQYEVHERYRINQEKLLEKMRERKGLPPQEPPATDLTLD